MVIFLIKDIKNIDFSKSTTNISPNDLQIQNLEIP